MNTTENTNKKGNGIKILFWISTTLIFLFEGVMPALTSQSDLAKEGIQHLGYPLYFGTTLVFFKVAGTIILMIPKFPWRIKEWAYAGFTFDFIFAAISHGAVDGINFQTFFPIIVLAVLTMSYIAYRKISETKSLKL